MRRHILPKRLAGLAALMLGATLAPDWQRAAADEVDVFTLHADDLDEKIETAGQFLGWLRACGYDVARTRDLTLESLERRLREFDLAPEERKKKLLRLDGTEADAWARMSGAENKERACKAVLETVARNADGNTFMRLLQEELGPAL